MKRYYVEYYQKVKKDDQEEKFLGGVNFTHKDTKEFPVARKAFLVGGPEKQVATRLVITEV